MQFQFNNFELSADIGTTNCGYCSSALSVLIARSYFTEPRIRNQLVYTAGDTVTYGQLANILEAVLECVEWSVPYLKGELANDPENPIKKHRAVFCRGKGVAWDVSVTSTGNRQQAINVVDVERRARINLR